MKPLLSLVMIVKNESLNIRAVLESAKPFVDSWQILDSGSTDGTQQIIDETMQGVPGHLAQESWQGYADTRNRVMQLAGDSTEFLLMLSGDELLRDGDKLREYLETQRTTDADCFFLKLFLDEAMNPAPRVFRTGSAWRYDDFDCGVHEVPVHNDKNAKTDLVPDAHIEHLVSDVAKRLDTIEQKHIPMLEAALARNPNNTRAYDCLTQSYESLMPYVDADEKKEMAETCVGLYHMRFTLPFSCDEEKRIFRMRYIDTARFTDLYSNDELFKMADELYKEDNTRPEVALMRADFSTRKQGVPLGEVYNNAIEALKVATDNTQLSNTSPLMMSCAWKAHRIAAIAAKQLSQGYEKRGQRDSSAEWLGRCRDHISVGLLCGGTWVMFKGIMGEPEAPTLSIVKDDAPLEVTVQE